MQQFWNLMEVHWKTKDCSECRASTCSSCFESNRKRVAILIETCVLCLRVEGWSVIRGNPLRKIHVGSLFSSCAGCSAAGGGCYHLPCVVLAQHHPPDELSHSCRCSRGSLEEGSPSNVSSHGEGRSGRTGSRHKEQSWELQRLVWRNAGQNQLHG